MAGGESIPGRVTTTVLDLLVAGSHGMPIIDAGLTTIADLVPHPVWDEVRQLPHQEDLDGSVAWFRDLMATEPPPAITGLWFGLFNPVLDDGGDASEIYVSGSTKPITDYEWPVDTTWWPDGRYRRSGVQRDIYRLTAATGDEQVAHIGDYLMTLTHAAATVSTILASVPVREILTGAASRAIAFGHDSGDRWTVALVTESAVERFAR